MLASATVPAMPVSTRPCPVRVSLNLSAVVRAGLGALLRAHGDRVQLLDQTHRGRAHVEVFDPDDQDLEPLPGVPRVALTWDPSPRAAALAREMGAVTVLPLSVEIGDLVRTVEQVGRERPAREPAAVGGLSPREADVVRGISRGLSNLEIAEELFLSVNSVKTYIRTAYRKMGVESRSQAVLWGFRHGL